MVFSGAVRDAAELRGMSRPFSARAYRQVPPRPPSNHQSPDLLAGTIIYPGDIILGDDDGVVVVPLARRRRFSSRPTKGRRRRSSQETSFGGESLFDIYGYQKVLDALHCVEEQD
jgi:4-hydroxy-4-methyl-2-oxoglutarate aldolase